MNKGNISLLKARPRRVDNIELLLREKGRGGMNLIGLSQETDQRRNPVNTVMKLGFYKTLGSS
jgi:hypothetical protein